MWFDFRLSEGSSGLVSDCLKGQVVWVTGASSGIGEALVYQLAAAGCRLVLSARRTEELERVKKQCLCECTTVAVQASFKIRVLE